MLKNEYERGRKHKAVRQRTVWRSKRQIVAASRYAGTAKTRTNKNKAQSIGV